MNNTKSNLADDNRLDYINNNEMDILIAKDNEILEVKSHLIDKVRFFMEAKLEGKIDLSYEWIEKLPNISIISKSIEISSDVLNNSLVKRDTACELKVRI
jgi:hypothetical protein